MAGSGLATASWEQRDDAPPRVNQLALLASPVPGKQTVPRAELWAACKAAEASQNVADAVLDADASYIMHGCANEGAIKKAKASPNGDLWTIYDDAARVNGHRMKVSKVDAHQHPSKIITGGMPLDAYIGNHLADAAANAAAERALGQSERAAAVAEWETRAFIIARRLAYVEAWHWRNDSREELLAPEPLPPWQPPEPAIVRNTLQERIDQQGHQLFRVNDEIACTRCHKKRGANDHRHWTGTTCIPKWAMKRTAPHAAHAHRNTRRRIQPIPDHEVTGSGLQAPNVVFAAGGNGDEGDGHGGLENHL